jgi:hypothetical protein
MKATSVAITDLLSFEPVDECLRPLRIHYQLKIRLTRPGDNSNHKAIT